MVNGNRTYHIHAKHKTKTFTKFLLSPDENEDNEKTKYINENKYMNNCFALLFV